ncbi:MAG: hypothetical protein PBV01_24115 [Brucella anthropi]
MIIFIPKGYIPAKDTPTRNRKSTPSHRLVAKAAKQRFKIAPQIAEIANMWLALYRSAIPVSERRRVPIMNPPCTALVSHPISDSPTFHDIISSAEAALALNHRDVPKSCAIEIVTIGPGYLARNGINLELFLVYLEYALFGL